MYRIPLFENTVGFNNETLAALQSSLSGELLRPGDLGYDEARLAWNRKVVQRPAMILVAKTARDIVWG